MLRKTALAFIALALLTSASAAQPLGLQDFHEFRLKAGANRIPNFAADGRAATVFVANRGNGNAWGYNIFMVTLPAENGVPFSVVAMPGSKGQVLDYGSDAPHTGEDAIRVVMLGRGRLDGKEQTVLLTATREITGPVPDPAITRFDVYRLAQSGGEVGLTPDYFELVRTSKSTRKYCNAHAALQTEFNIPAQKGLIVFNQKTGCA